MLDCLAKTRDEYAEHQGEFKLVEGVKGKFALHVGRLESHREAVAAMIAELPDDFFPQHGGGMSFVNLVVDRHGHQWGEQRDAEALFVLASGLGAAQFVMPRELWSALPGGMPYMVFAADAKEAQHV